LNFIPLAATEKMVFKTCPFNHSTIPRHHGSQFAAFALADAPPEISTVDPFLNRDMGAGLELKVAFRGIHGLTSSARSE
jgi:hypothetical protein